MHQDVLKITEFLHTMNGLKNLLRFKGMPNWDDVSINRWDSVAEHSYRMALMATLYYPYLEEKPNLEKVLKMTLAHDIVELLANDYSPIKGHSGAGGHAFDSKAYEDKVEREDKAAKVIFSVLPERHKEEFYGLWKEYADSKFKKEKASLESRYAYALDKLEANMQIIDWKDHIKNFSHEQCEKSIKYMNEWSGYDKALSQVAEILAREMKKMQK